MSKTNYASLYIDLQIDSKNLHTFCQQYGQQVCFEICVYRRTRTIHDSYYYKKCHKCKVYDMLEQKNNLRNQIDKTRKNKIKHK